MTSFNREESLVENGSIGQEAPFMTDPHLFSANSLRLAKRLVDVLFALLFFIVLGWLFLLVGICVWITSGGPVIYSQSRIGKDGRIFRFYKFRSMVPEANLVLKDCLSKDPDAQHQWDTFQKLERDPRITKFGSFIRKTSLDELPQFWNVLMGDMSLVGPRPCMIEQKKLYGKNWNYYCAVRPGLTGLWQVSGRNHLNFAKRVELDVVYVRTLSVRGDLSIFFKTIWVVITAHGSR